MDELSLKVFNMIKEGPKIPGQIISELGISNQMLINILDILINKFGCNIRKKYFSDGSTRLFLNKSLYEENYGNIVTININSGILKALVISDTHYGHINDKFTLIKKSYDYCLRKDIPIIMMLGDFIDGTHHRTNGKYDNIWDLANYTIDNYPYDSRINNFMLLGNHDFHSIKHDGIDVGKIFTNNRLDFTIVGYGTGYIHVLNDYIKLSHKLRDKNNFSPVDTSQVLELIGHEHIFDVKYKINSGRNRCSVWIPSLSPLCKGTKNSRPGAVELEVNFEDDFIRRIIIKHLNVGKDVTPVKEDTCSFYFRRVLNHPDVSAYYRNK